MLDSLSLEDMRDFFAICWNGLMRTSNDDLLIIRQLNCYIEDRFKLYRPVVWYDLLGNNGVEFVCRDVDTGINWTGYVRFSRLWESWAKDFRSTKEEL